MPAGDATTASQSFSFSRLSRLTTQAQFQRVFNGARRSGDRYFTVLYRDNDGGEGRLGFAVAKKRISKATGRNHVRRIARESFRHSRHQLGGLDIIIMAQTAAASATNAELFASLTRHWERLAKGEETGKPRRNRGNKA